MFMFGGHSNLGKMRIVTDRLQLSILRGQISLQRRWASRRPTHSKWTKSKKGEKAIKVVLFFLFFSICLSAQRGT